MQVQFWGVRGSVPVSGERYHETGGSTSCVELCAGEERLILDAGTGIRALGEQLGVRPLRLTLVLSHVHWDHIMGFPFFLPAFHPESRITLVGAPELHTALQALMRPPNYPLRLDQLPARLAFCPLLPGQSLEIGPFHLSSAPLRHPDAVLALRIAAGGTTVVYATDHEHGEALDEGLVRLSEDADLLIHDAQYTDEEYPARRGWGHSRWAQAVAPARRAGARRLALFHHDPTRDDRGVRQIERAARARLPGAFAAREGTRLAL